VVLYKTDAEKDGVKLAKSEKVKGYPTFILQNAKGETIERWAGYSKEYLLATLGPAVADPTTIEEKRARFKKKATATDADKLAAYHGTRGEVKESVELSRKAVELEPNDDRRMNLVTAVADGVRQGEMKSDALLKERDALLASGTKDPKTLTYLVMVMKHATEEKPDPKLFVPVLEPAIAATKDDPNMQTEHEHLLVDKALYIEKNKSKASDLKKATMPEGWTEDPKQLNSFAWWSFENEVNLEEAESLARKGEKLAPAGADKAMVLDTLAEILYARGKKTEAVAAIEQAVKEHPEKEYYKKQLDRFRGTTTETN
jgi:tetratricopeptide (TPR) repeat protein